MFTVWAVYKHPKDYPGQYIARKWTVESQQPGSYTEKATDEIEVSPSLDEIRRRMKKLGLIKLGRLIGDDPVIVETWL